MRRKERRRALAAAAGGSGGSGTPGAPPACAEVPAPPVELGAWHACSCSSRGGPGLAAGGAGGTVCARWQALDHAGACDGRSRCAQDAKWRLRQALGAVLPARASCMSLRLLLFPLTEASCRPAASIGNLQGAVVQRSRRTRATADPLARSHEQAATQAAAAAQGRSGAAAGRQAGGRSRRPARAPRRAHRCSRVRAAVWTPEHAVHRWCSGCRARCRCRSAAAAAAAACLPPARPLTTLPCPQRAGGRCGAVRGGPPGRAEDPVPGAAGADCQRRAQQPLHQHAPGAGHHRQGGGHQGGCSLARSLAAGR